MKIVGTCLFNDKCFDAKTRLFDDENFDDEQTDDDVFQRISC